MSSTATQAMTTRSRDGHGRYTRTLDSAQQDAHAVRLRTAGQSYERIAHSLGYSSRSAAFRAVQRTLSDVVRSDVDELREREVARLNAMHTQLWTQLMEPSTEVFPRMEIVTLLLRVSDQRSKLLGLYPSGDASKKNKKLLKGAWAQL